MNSFGRIFRISLWGESHGEVVGVTVDGVPAGIPLCEDDFAADLARRRAGGCGTTARREDDVPHIRSGVWRSHTTGAPVTVEFVNSDTRSADYARFDAIPRPSHADFTARAKYGAWNDPRGGGVFSGRMTVGIVAAGVIAKKILSSVRFSTTTVKIADCTDAERFDDIAAAAAAAGDSLGGVVECRAAGVPVGWGEPFFDSAESLCSHMLFAIPAVKGVEFGSGFEGVALRGSERNDCFVDSAGHTASNHEGGVNGGITNGGEIVLRVAVKPAASISLPQHTFDFARGEMCELQIAGRHDACIVRRAEVVVEAAVAVALADMKLLQCTRGVES